MKKYFISISKLAAATIVAFTLAACGEEVQIQENPNVKKVTKFTSGNDGTRTSMDSERHFYWFDDDQIWVDTDGNGTFTTMSDYSQPSQDYKSADFYVNGIELTAQSYNILYTGNGSTTGTSVTIPATRDYTTWNDKEAFGQSGDCGTATATRNSAGNYTFQLKHQAAYLVVLPYIYAFQKAKYSVQKVVITAENSTIAGTYPFSMSGLDTQNVTNASNTITINLGGNLNQTSHMPIVIQPGTHKLTVTFTAFGLGGFFQEYTFQLPEREYKANSSTNFSQYFYPEYCQWDAPLAGKFADDNFNTTPDEAASQLCHLMPNVNEMSWYMKNGDMRWDATETWNLGHINGGGNTVEYTGGVWIKKKAAILADATGTKCINEAHGGNGPTFCSEHSVNGQDLRVTPTTAHFSTNNLGILNKYILGRPDDTTDYFFLPAMGQVDKNTKQLKNVGNTGFYWTSTPYIGNTNDAWVFGFGPYDAALGFSAYRQRNRIFPAIPALFQ